MTDAAIDHAVLRELEDATGTDFAQDLVSTFLEEAPGQIADLRAAAAAADADGFRRAAHSIKSNAATFGATILMAQARALELSGLPDEAGPPLDALAAAFDEARAALESYRDG
jgi:HPt (histidine-containing phosphotransfer) domain-containing protein